MQTFFEMGSKELFSSERAAVNSLRVLVVEDEVEIRELIAMHLRRLGYVVDDVRDAEAAVSLVQNQIYSLIVVDWMLPGMNGIEFTRYLRHRQDLSGCPILFVTAKADPENIIEGLEAGADDYITKPFEASILIARIRALLRRVTGVSDVKSNAEELRVGNLVMYPKLFEVRVHGEKVILTPSEFKLLQALIASQGRVLTRERLIELVQGEGVSVVGRTVDTHVFGLRKKLGDCADFIETVRGIGYRIRFPESVQ